MLGWMCFFSPRGFSSYVFSDATCQSSQPSTVSCFFFLGKNWVYPGQTELDVWPKNL